MLYRYTYLLFILLATFNFQKMQAQCLSLSLQNQAALQGEEVCVNVVEQRLSNVRSYVYTIEWNTAVLDFVDLRDDNFATLGQTIIDETVAGRLTVSWTKNTDAPFMVPNNLTVHSLCFDVRTTAGDNAVSLISFIEGDDPTEVFDINDNELNFGGLGGSVAVGDTTSPVKITSGCSTNSDCATNEVGSINITESDAGPYSYVWEGPNSFTSVDSDLSGYLDGVYTVEIRNDDFDRATGLFTTRFLNPLVLDGFSIEDATCGGMEDGTIDLTISGGSGSYSVLWSNGDQTEDLLNVDPGIYSVSITDDNSDCSIERTFEVRTVVDLEVGFYQVQCESSVGQDGAITITVNGGTAPFSYIWSNGDTTQNLIDISAGEYMVTVTDVNDCQTVSPNIEVCQTSEPEAGACLTLYAEAERASPGDSICVEIKVNNFVNVVSLQHSLFWDDRVLAVDTAVAGALPNLFPANFNLDDAVPQNSALRVTWDDPTVQGVSLDDESVLYTVCFDVIGDSGEQSSIFFTNNPTEIEVIVRDGGNLMPDNVNVFEGQVLVSEENPTLRAFLSCLDEPICKADLNGLIDIIVVGGVEPYDYVWNNGMTTQDLEDVGAGSYSLTITDADNSTIIFNQVLDNPGRIIFDSSRDTALCGVNSATIDLFVDAVGATTLSWSPFDVLSCGECPNPTATVTETTTFTVTTVNDLGCRESETITIYLSDTLVIDNLNIEGLGDEYIVSFEVIGGDQASYQVTGMSGTLDGYTFTSDPIPVSSGYEFIVSDNSLCDEVIVRGASLADCEDYSFCVWPGDVNVDGMVNHKDLLLIGLTQNTVGPERADASIDWTGQFSNDWTLDLPVSGVNFKHCDTDGSGRIDEDDVEALELNWTQVNTFGQDPVIDLIDVDGDLEIGSSSAFTEEVLRLPIRLNSPSSISGYAVALSVGYEADKFSDQIVLDLVDSDFGNSDDLLRVIRSFPDENRIDLAISRKDGNDVELSNILGFLELEVLRGATGGEDSVEVVFQIEEESLINSFEMTFDLGLGTGSTSIIRNGSVSTVETNQLGISIFPNPVKGSLNITTDQWKDNLHVEICNLLSQSVIRQPLSAERTSLNLSGVKSGVYFINVYDNSELQYADKIIVIK